MQARAPQNNGAKTPHPDIVSAIKSLTIETRRGIVNGIDNGFNNNVPQLHQKLDHLNFAKQYSNLLLLIEPPLVAFWEKYEIPKDCPDLGEAIKILIERSLGDPGV